MRSATTTAKTERGLSITKATFPMVGSILGSGVLTLPTAVEYSGYLLSAPILIFISSVCAFTLFQLVHCAKNLETKDPSYFKVCQNTFPALGYIAEACIGAQGLGAVFVYFLILKTWISEFLGLKEQIKYLPYNIAFSAVLMIVPTFLAMQKNLKKLAFISILSTISVVFLSLVVLLSGVLSVLLPSTGIQKDVLKAYTKNPWDIFSALSFYIFGLGCQQNMVKIFSLLDKPTKANGTKVGIFSIAIASFAYFLVANGGYFAGGNNQGTSILDILADKDRSFYKQIIANFGEASGNRYFYLIQLAKIAMTIVLFGAYPLQMHPTRDSIVTFLNLPFKDYVSRNKRKAEIAVISCVTLLLLIGSLGDIKYGFVMNLIANTASCYIMFSLPSISYIFSNKTKVPFTVVSSFILVGSILFSFISTYNLIAGLSKN
ncbi:hypothetical protein NEMIN01_1512 [Nematocida minor]|uniref:uncharacterized protein n=1 Tax=Nematocida minor TaxID=1912983 RepID=UPI0022200771|nr:uncharacterized protein NEMIN01_1512 [Nematocida minor]KAI5191436.1 hypothetical protein NEMIN01_1512 [Nematocida minor]